MSSRTRGVSHPVLIERVRTHSRVNRYSLGYHTPHQIYWGLGIGILLGSSVYLFTELLPRWFPQSLIGQVKMWALDNPVSTWCQIRDGWDVWADGGRETEWLRWKDEWDERRRRAMSSGKAKLK